MKSDTSWLMEKDRSSMLDDPMTVTSSSTRMNFACRTVGEWYWKIRTPASTSSS
jgi:hypothetical protein